jgi:hypothetical protein
LNYFKNSKDIEKTIDHSFSPAKNTEAKYDKLPKKTKVQPAEEDMTSIQAYLMKVSRQKLFPKTHGLVHWKGNETEICSSNFSMGDSYA